MNVSFDVWKLHYRNDLIYIYRYFQSIDEFFVTKCKFSVFCEFCYDYTSNHNLD